MRARSLAALCAFFALLLASLPAFATSLAHMTVEERVRALAELGDRSSGSPGNAQAADMIEAAFGELIPEEGRTLGRQTYFIPVQDYREATLTLAGTGRSAPIRPVRLNYLSCPAIAAPGLDAQVYYAGSGTLEEFNGMDVSGSVVLMDLDSGKNWINAANLGARALIYVDPGPSDTPNPRSLYEDKFEQTPIDFPRFRLALDEAEDLFGPLKHLRTASSAPKVRLTSEIYWKNVPAANIYCRIPGTDPALEKEIVIYEAFYDSTAYVPGRSPGAGEAVSMATLLALAEELGKNPPQRPVLLLATDGHAHDVHGMREFVWALKNKSKLQKALMESLEERAEKAKKTIALLESPDPLGEGILADDEKAHLVREAALEVVKNRIDKLSTELMRLRLLRGKEKDKAKAGEMDIRIKSLAADRLALKRMRWVTAPKGADTDLENTEREVLETLFEKGLVRQRAIYKDALGQHKSVKSSRTLRKLVKGEDNRIVASMSLHLSSRGDGVGGFEKGWLYELKSKVKRARLFSEIDDLMRKTGEASSDPSLFKDTLRPSKVRPWQSWLPDRPALGGEPAALAALPGFSLATVNDSRPYWGTPWDTPEHMEFEYLERQTGMVLALARALADKPVPESEADVKNGFCDLTGRVNLLRQGELFPDQPATGSVFLTFQGPSRFMSMVDTAGVFHVKGLAIKKQTVHKAVLEGFRFDSNTGRAVWAVDKPMTGKANYRVKMRRKNMETDLVMFSCSQSTFFSMLEPRTFRYLYVPEVIDGRTESRPLRYWYSRLDTRSSTLGTFFLEPDVPLKLTLSDNFIDKKVVLLNANEKNPQGLGYRAADWPVIPMTEYMAAKDMWSLLTPRVMNLEEKGIINDRIRELRIKGQTSLREAEEYKAEKQWDKFFEKTGEALAIASQVYNDVDKTQKDVLVGVLFYIALFGPFAYCLERLLFGFTNINKRIAAFGFLLGGIILAVYLVHPAFQLTYSPMVVILAFFILGLSLLVSLIIFFRFEREMEELQRRSKHLKAMQISRAGAFGAAFVLGVSNLRRRPLRTALTVITLTILTFTIMNFTAVKSVRQRGWSHFSDHASYNGAMMKYFGWKDLPVETLASVENTFDDRGVVVPRAWYVTEDLTRAPMVPVTAGLPGAEGAFSDTARGLIGLSHKEPAVSGLDKVLVTGRWFGEGERNAVILPETMASKLGVVPDDPARNTVTIWGMPFTVTGVMADNGLRDHPDLDGEPMTPVVYPSEAAGEISDIEAEAIAEGEDVLEYQSRYQHVDGDQTVIIPAETLLSMGGGAGRLKGVAVKTKGLDAPNAAASGKKIGPAEALARELGDRYGLMLFKGGKEGTSLFFASNSMSYKGMSNIVIPLLIAALIVLNTMIGSVYERKREIAVYTSVGLAPSHVGFLFVAEALALAVISVVAGYLLAQGSAAVLAGTPLWAGMTANYSSTAGVAAMVLVILVVLASTIYPSRVAAEIAIPDVNRSWSMPEADGDRLDVPLPFLIKLEEQICAGGFLLEYYRSHQDISHGEFSTDNLACDFLLPRDLPGDLPRGFRPKKDPGGTEDLWEDFEGLPPALTGEACFMLDLRVWLAPFDFGVRQHVRLIFCPSSTYEGFREILVRITREAGEKTVWWNLNKNFINDLRKQLLIWRSLEDGMREVYEQGLQDEVVADRPASEVAK